MTTKHLHKLGQRLLAGLLKNAKTVSPGGQSFRGLLIDSATFAETEYKLTWVVQDILVRDQLCVVGGPKKALKTNAMLDLVISIASGKDFLGKFKTEGPLPVAFFSAESGEATLKETALRICKEKGVKLAKLPLFWAFELPQFSNEKDLATLSRSLRLHRPAVAVFDPLYLSLLAGETDLQASNLYHIGPLLRDMASTCLGAGVTPVLVHHLKQTRPNHFEPPELGDLAFAGIQEFARQWMLLGRREKFDPDTGEHHLWLVTGGSAGFAGCWALDVKEGLVNQGFQGRDWKVTVRSRAQEQQAQKKQKAQGKKREQKKDRAKLLKALEIYPKGETCTVLAESAKLSNRRARAALDQMVHDKVVMKMKFSKGGRQYDGYRRKLATLEALEDENDGAEDAGEGGDAEGA